ncbi:hypothetical protein RGQ01_07670 [Akkermansia sp. EB-AMDK43]|jgi:hypothetical protein|nr:hypothetical protein [Akkermansia sp. EB-AMDK43]WMX36905.1 hypothetical protein RGQ01_07670 [Akkermansia sp. EB-AMDK43]
MPFRRILSVVFPCRSGTGGEGRAALFRPLFSSAPEMNFELAAAGEKEHE